MRNKINSAHEKIKRWLLKGYAITPYKAWVKFSCYRLSSVIHRLKTKEKLPIETKIMFAGKTVSYAQYFIPKKKVHP